MEKYDTIAKGLYGALNSTPINTSFLINTIKHSDNLDRQFIRESYYKINDVYLLEDLRCLRAIEGKSFECLMIALFRSPAEFDTYEISDAVDGVGTNDDVLSEIIGTRDTNRIQEIKKFYSVFFFNKLEDVIKGEIKEKDSCKDYLDFLDKILSNRNLTNSGQAQMNRDINSLNMINNFSRQDQLELFSRILLKENSQYLRDISLQIRDTYFKRNTEITNYLQIKNQLGKLLIYSLKGQADFILFYVERLYNALKGAKKDNKRIVRSLMSVYPVNMTEFRTLFESVYKVSMDNCINENTSGLFRDLLLVVANCDNVMKFGVEITSI